MSLFRQEIALDSALMNAAGMLGFAPASPSRWPVSEVMGAFITNPISLGPRTPAGGRGLLAYPGGALLHSGLPNPGFSRVLRRYGERWAQSNLPIWVHLIGANPGEIHEMVRRLEGREGVMAIELGLPPDEAREAALAFIEAALGELPLVVHLPVNQASESWIGELAGLGISAVSLGAPRGMLPDSAGRLVSGRLYGPALLPMTLAAVHHLRKSDLPVIAGAGVYRRQDVQALREAGALAVQLDTVLWRGWVE